MTWFWVLLGKHFDKRNGIVRQESLVAIHWTKIDKSISEMDQGQRRELAEKIASGFLVTLGKRE